MPALELLKEIRELELKSRKNVTGFFPGNYATSIAGSGMTFREARKYLPGDPVRHIDWNMTARLGDTYVRTYEEEREREIFLAIDISPSMEIGYGERSKFATAIEIAATIAFSAVRAGDRFGYLFFSDHIERFRPPRSGKLQLHHLLRDLVELEAFGLPYASQSDPRLAIEAIEALRSRRFVIFFLSDFIDVDVPEDLNALRQHHDVSLLHIYDRFEFRDTRTANGDLLLPLVAPESGSRAVLGGLFGSRAGKRHGVIPDSLAELRNELDRAAARHRILVESISCDAGVGPALGAFFHRRRRVV